MLATLVLALAGLALFVAPHRRGGAAAQASLLGLTRDLLRAPQRGQRHAGLGVLFLFACMSVWLPAVLLVVVRVAPGGAARWLLGLGAAALFGAAAALWLLMTLSRSTFGFGPGRVDDRTLAARSMPVFLVGAAAMAALGAASADWAVWLRGQ